MPISFDTLNQQLASIKNSEALYIKNDSETVKGAGTLGKLFRSQASFNNAVNAFCDAISEHYGSAELGQLTCQMMTLSGEAKLNAGMAKVMMAIAPQLKSFEPTNDNVRLLLDALKPCFKTGVPPSESFLTTVTDIIRNKPLTAGGGCCVMGGSVVERQGKLDILKAFYGPTETVNLKTTFAHGTVDVLGAFANIGLIKAKYPHGRITPAMVLEMRHGNSWGVSFKPRQVNKMTPEQLRHFIAEMENREFDWRDENTCPAPVHHSAMTGIAPDNAYQNMGLHFSQRQVDDLANRAMNEGESLVFTERDMLEKSMIPALMLGFLQYGGNVHAEDGSIHPENCYRKALGDLNRLGVDSQNPGELHLSLVNADGTEQSAEIGTPLCNEMNARMENDPAGVREQGCLDIFQAIGTRCRSKEQHAIVMLALTQCGSMSARNIAETMLHGSAGLNEHAPMDVKVSFDQAGNAHVKYTLAEAVRERHGSLEAETIIAPNGTITHSGFSWTTAAYHFQD